jgi:hypothetical protein
MARAEFDNAQPSQSLGILGLQLDFLLKRVDGAIQIVGLVLSDSQEEVNSLQVGIQGERLRKRLLRFSGLALTKLAHPQAQISLWQLGSGGYGALKEAFRLGRPSLAHGLGARLQQLKHGRRGLRWKQREKEQAEEGKKRPPSYCRRCMHHLLRQKPAAAPMESESTLAKLIFFQG